MRPDLPSGTVTFLFTDIEGSTRLLDELGADAYAAALSDHHRVVRAALEANGGIEIDTAGDGFFTVFPGATRAVAAARAMQDGLAGGPVRVRMGLHTGTPRPTDEGYVGPDVHLAARIAAAGHGGQALVSATAVTGASLAGTDELMDLGEHRLKDIDGPVHIFQLGTEPFPPLRTIANTNLPRPVNSFVGREREVAELLSLLRDGSRLVTLVGAGGTGKTRLAIEAASALVPGTKAGVFWVDLSATPDPAVVPEAIARVLGARGELGEHIGERELVLVLDNFEQVVDAAPLVGDLVERCPNLRILVTSRERLRVRGETAHAVAPLGEGDAIALFADRAGLVPDEPIRELCRRLDNLPLAVELAAARANLLSPTQILQRLGQRLDLFRGSRDTAARQGTLRSTIAWSYDLLQPQEQRVFARLAVFRGGSTLEAAERVCEADIDTLQSLVDKSLVRSDGERLSMLETIGAYAGELLDMSPGSDVVRARHAHYFVALAAEQGAKLRRGEPEEGPVAVLEADIENMRVATDWLADHADVEGARSIGVALPIYWEMRGRYAEARRWLDRVVALGGPDDDIRRRLLLDSARFAYAEGDHLAATASADEAARLASVLGDAVAPLDRLRERGLAAFDAGDYDETERIYRERLALAIAIDNGVATSACRLMLALIANRRGHYDESRTILDENLVFVRGRGQTRCEANTLMSLADTALLCGEPATAGPMALRGAELSLDIRDEPTAAVCLDITAVTAAADGHHAEAATILAATDAARKAMGMEPDEDEARIRNEVVALLGHDPGQAAQKAVGSPDLDLAAAFELASELGVASA